MKWDFPTVDNMKCAERLWKRFELDKADNVVRQAFSIWTDDTDVSQVKAKIGVLGALWEAGVQDIRGWAEKIIEVAAKGDFKKRLRTFDITLFEQLATFKTSRQRKKWGARVAASKYLHFSSPNVYPIWDSSAIWAARNRIGLQVSGDYQEWRNTLDRIRLVENQEFSYKQIDQYLWLLGYAIPLEQEKEPCDKEHWVTRKLRKEEDWEELLPPRHD